MLWHFIIWLILLIVNFIGPFVYQFWNRLVKLMHIAILLQEFSFFLKVRYIIFWFWVSVILHVGVSAHHLEMICISKQTNLLGVLFIIVTKLTDHLAQRMDLSGLFSQKQNISGLYSIPQVYSQKKFTHNQKLTISSIYNFNLKTYHTLFSRILNALS